MRNFYLEKILGKSYERYQIFLLCYFSHLGNNSVQNVMGKNPRCQLMVLNQFDHVFVVMNYL